MLPEISGMRWAQRFSVMADRTGCVEAADDRTQGGEPRTAGLIRWAGLDASCNGRLPWKRL